MARGKSINLFLMDGDTNGMIKRTLANWIGIAYKIPRSSLDNARTEQIKYRQVFIIYVKIVPGTLEYKAFVTVDENNKIED